VDDVEMDEVSVRRARQDDADAIADVFLASFAATYRFPLAHSDEQVRRWIPEILLPTEEVWVVTDPDEAVVALMALSSEMLGQLYVAPGWTGRGIGSRLIELAKSRRPDGLDLFTFQVNAGARRFYERHGFVEVWRGDGSDNEEGQPDLRCAWRPSSQPMASGRTARARSRR
jgi:GNAT superfamily N-acetyltransferase